MTGGTTGRLVATVILAAALPARAGEKSPAEGVLAQLLGHRTHRRYTADPVPDDVLEIALSAALSSPSKSDLQQVGVIVVRDRGKQAAIGALIPDMPWIATAPLFMVFCGDNRRIRRDGPAVSCQADFKIDHQQWANDRAKGSMHRGGDSGVGKVCGNHGARPLCQRGCRWIERGGR